MAPFLSQRAFTLLELLIVVAIIGILAAIAIPAYNGYVEFAKQKRCIAEIRTIEKAIAAYHNDTGEYPNSLADVQFGALTDPWGFPYYYLRIDGGGTNGNGNKRRDRNLNPLNSDYDLFSVGKNGVYKKQLNNKDSLDDIVRANDGAFVDLAEKF